MLLCQKSLFETLIFLSFSFSALTPPSAQASDLTFVISGKSQGSIKQRKGVFTFLNGVP